MAVLEFVLIPSYEEQLFRSYLESYLEEIDLLVGDPVDPDLNHRYPLYSQYFRDDPFHQPFRILASNPDLPPNIQPPEFIGFFFLTLISPQDFPSGIKSIIDSHRKVASLTDLYIFPEFRRKGLAWDFY